MNMRKLCALLIFALLFNASCSYQSDKQELPAPVAYSDWDRAIRVDVDMQNMYATSPKKINKPIDMYMAFALAVKYNYTRRIVSYEQSVVEAGKSPEDRLPEIFASAGYINGSDSKNIDSELKLAWNLLDIGSVYFQSQDAQHAANLGFEQSRKVIHNLLQETRSLYWKALTAQKLLPTVNDMIEFMTLEVDELNSKGNELAQTSESLSREELVKKRKYMQSVKKLSYLKRDLLTSQVRLASLMGLHPSTEYKLVGKEYGNFDLPEIKNSLSEMEWLALTSRPELRVRDLSTNINEIKASFRVLKDPGENAYQNDPSYYNRLWSRKAKELGMKAFEDVKNPNVADLESLRRQRMTNIVLTQVYVSWARYMSAYENYQINTEIANVSEDIAEDIVVADGSLSEKGQLESSRAIADELKAMLAYIELQDSLGNMYSAMGLDALPYYMLSEKPSKIAVYLNENYEKWRKGEFMPDNRPYLLNVPTKRPPVNLSNAALVPDIKLETGEAVNFTLPNRVFERMEFTGELTLKSGLKDDSPLPKWLKFDEESRTFSGLAMPSNVGSYTVKVYVVDKNGNVGYLLFDIIIDEVYVPSLRVQGLTKGRKATVLKRCIGAQCTDKYIEQRVIGADVVTKSY